MSKLKLIGQTSGYTRSLEKVIFDEDIVKCVSCGLSSVIKNNQVIALIPCLKN